MSSVDLRLAAGVERVADALEKLVELAKTEFDDSLVFETDGSAHKRSDYSSMGDQLNTLSDALSNHKDRIIVEANGRKYEVTRVVAIGTKTDDPGLVIHLD